MKKICILTIAILIVFLTVTGCGNGNTVKNIKAESFSISYGKSIFEVKDKVDSETIDSLIKDYNNIKLDGKTNQAINNNKAITIIFINNDQISGQLTVDDKGICCFQDNLDNYIINEDSKIYQNALKVYKDIKKKYES